MVMATKGCRRECVCVCVGALAYGYVWDDDDRLARKALNLELRKEGQSKRMDDNCVLCVRVCVPGE